MKVYYILYIHRFWNMIILQYNINNSILLSRWHDTMHYCFKSFRWIVWLGSKLLRLGEIHSSEWCRFSFIFGSNRSYISWKETAWLHLFVTLTASLLFLLPIILKQKVYGIEIRFMVMYDCYSTVFAGTLKFYCRYLISTEKLHTNLKKQDLLKCVQNMTSGSS